MRCLRPALISGLLLGLSLTCSGCYGPYQSPYGGYGSPYGGYQMPGTPVPTLQPGGTYTPTPYGQPVPTYGAPAQDSLGNPSPIDQTGGDAPFYNSNSNSTYQPQQPYDGGGVPTYNDPNEIQFQQPVQPDNTAIDTYGAVEGASAEVADVAKVDLDTAHFVAPVMSAATSSTPVISTEVSAAPFAHDADYTWLRGVLRFDDSTGNWTMIYSDNPAPDDEHGGKLLVTDSPLLEQFKPQAVVLLRGEIDQQQSAVAGRAVFRADVIEPAESPTR